MTSRRVWTRFDRLGLVLMLWLVMILTACGSSVENQTTSTEKDFCYCSVISQMS